MAKQQKEISKQTFNQIAAEYAPYNLFPEFQHGAEAYMDRLYTNPYDNVAAQAWDRGAEAAMKYTRQFQ